jgi:hypothetical protein
MLYRTHKSLEPQFKVPSLYAFDALARAARTHALKYGFTGDAQRGNGATFLLKLEAVLEGLFHDMMGSDVSEGKVSKHMYTTDLSITPGRIFCVSGSPFTGHRVGLPGCHAENGNGVAPPRGMYSGLPSRGIIPILSIATGLRTS